MTPHLRRLLLLVASFGIPTFLSLAMPGVGWGMGLVTTGIPSDYLFDCSNLTLTKADVLGGADHWYQFEGSCVFKPGPAAHVDSVSVIVHTKWVEWEKKALEKVLFQSETGGWIDTVTVCGADPWLNHATTCSGILSSPSEWILHFLTQAGVNAKDAPLTRNLADAQTAAKVNVPVGQTPPPPAPKKVTILSPAKNQVVVGDHVLVTTKWPVTFSPAEAGQSLCMINFQWWHLTLSADGSPSAGVVPVMGFIETLADCVASEGLSYSRTMLRDLLYERKLASLEAGGKGEWRISVGKLGPSGYTTDLQLLSDWRNFTIADPSYQFEIVRGLQRQAMASDVESRSTGRPARAPAREPAPEAGARRTPDASSRAGAVPPVVDRESPVAGGRAVPARVIVATIVSASPVKAGRTGTLFVLVKNTGLRRSAAPVKLSVKCRVVSGGPCPLDERVQALPKLESGQMVTVAVRGTKLATPGVYAVSALVLPGTAREGKSIDLTVE